LDSVWSTICVLGQRGNSVGTTRYRWWTFLPLAIFEQSRILTNVYFLITVVICWLRWSPVHYLFQMIPMVVVSLHLNGEIQGRRPAPLHRGQAPQLRRRLGSSIIANGRKSPHSN
jgi:hypothetical protein